MRYLAIDWGGKRVGLAIGNDVTFSASPLQVIETASLPQRWQWLAQAIDEHGPGALLIGLPLNMDGTQGPAAKQALALARELEQRFHLPVHPVDERLTSFAADQLMSRSGLTRQGKKQRRDALAALTLLQDFLAAKKRGVSAGDGEPWPSD